MDGSLLLRWRPCPYCANGALLKPRRPEEELGEPAHRRAGGADGVRLRLLQLQRFGLD